MIPALLKGKLSREQENMEDILTSMVFGRLQYLPIERGLLPFLSCAESGDGSKPLEYLRKAEGVVLEHMEFWPWWEHSGCIGCEPDVAVRLTMTGGRKLLLCVEAKFLSGKSSEADEADTRPCDQLAREWDNLLHVAKAEAADPILIYLTAQMAFPRDEIAASESEIREKRQNGARLQCCWLSWRHLPGVLSASTDPVSNDLKDALLRLNLYFFHGFTPKPESTPISWRFREPDHCFNWSYPRLSGITWRYGA